MLLLHLSHVPPPLMMIIILKYLCRWVLECVEISWQPLVLNMCLLILDFLVSSSLLFLSMVKSGVPLSVPALTTGFSLFGPCSLFLGKELQQQHQNYSTDTLGATLCVSNWAADQDIQSQFPVPCVTLNKLILLRSIKESKHFKWDIGRFHDVQNYCSSSASSWEIP